MKRSLLVFLLLGLVIAFFPQQAQAVAIGPSIRFHPCNRADGLYTLKVEAVEGFSTPVGFNGTLNNVGYNLWYSKNGGPWTFYGVVHPGWIGTFWGLPEGTTFEFKFGGMTQVDPPDAVNEVNGVGIHSIKLEGTDYPQCETCTGNPLFKMYLLTRSDSYCLIISDLHPSIERQKAICFPGTNWVATSTPCVGWVCDNDCWECDVFGFERLSLKNLRPIYAKHLSRSE